MLRCSRCVRYKASEVTIRSNLTQAKLAFTPGYKAKKKYHLALKYNQVDEASRYESLRILLDRLSGYAGRKQYKFQNDLSGKLFETLKQEGIDWHDLKALSYPSLVELTKRTNLTPAERAVLFTALDARVCGVLTEGHRTRDPQTICFNSGVEEHGWRCGQKGHTNHLYFEHKPSAVARLVEQRRLEIEKRYENGVSVEVHEEPDFNIVGRMTHEEHPRVWSRPQDPAFNVSVIGFEFRVHPEDPRAQPQVVDAAKEWQLHEHVVKSVVWEMLELYGVPRAAQPLFFSSGEMTPENQTNESSTSAADTAAEDRHATPISSADVITEVPVSMDGAPEEEEEQAFLDENTNMFNSLGEDGVLVERKMRLRSAKGSTFQQPWFRAAPPQKFASDGTPEFLPFPASMIIRGVFRPLVGPEENVAELGAAEIERRLMNPLLDVSVLMHPDACFWFSPEEEEKCLTHILSYATRVPYCVPFNLYLRVDPSEAMRDETFAKKQESLLHDEGTRSMFDPAQFVTRYNDELKKRREAARQKKEESSTESGQHRDGDENEDAATEPETLDVDTVEKKD